MAQKKQDAGALIWVIVLVIAIIAAGVGYGLQRLEPPSSEHHGDVHSHMGTVEVPTGSAIPAVQIQVHPDSVSGFNVQVITSNFQFAPENVGDIHVFGQGHAHVYVDGVKTGRVYGEWFYLDDLSPGEHVIQVALNANDHRDYVVNGNFVEAVATVTVEE